MLRLEARSAASDWMRLASPPIAVAFPIRTGFLIFAILGQDPTNVLDVLFITPLPRFYVSPALLLKANAPTIIPLSSSTRTHRQAWEHGA